MLKELEYSVTFPTPNPGKTFAGSFIFEEGVTAVTGPNWAGKSLGTIEMARYGLFGKAALRGSADDYKTLDMSLTFEIGGETYKVERGPKKEQLTSADGTVRAVKATGVNQEIRKILGFGLDVFDIVCACNQKESERLSRLKPTERKRLIDEVVGLSQNEAVEKACKQEALIATREADALQDALPTIPDVVAPDGYRPLNDVTFELEQAVALQQKRDQLQRQTVLPPEPGSPTVPRMDLTQVEQLHDAITQQRAHKVDLERRLAAIPEAQWTAAQLDDARQIITHKAEVQRRGPQPITQMLPEAVKAQLEVHAQHRAISMLPEVDTHCPACAHTFNTRPTLPLLPAMSKATLAAELTALEAWSVPLMPMVSGPALTERQIMEAEQALARVAERQGILCDLAAQGQIPNAPDLAGARSADRAWSAYETQLAQFQTAEGVANAAQAELDALPPTITSVAELRNLHTACHTYENMIEFVTKVQAQREATLATIAEKRDRAIAFKEGAAALVEARTVFKAHLTPSLSRVASALISQMTGGRLQDIEVDEEMNILVGGQEISTLSGAGATLANLALRIGLGRVLVSKVFPTFIGDEIDSDMDATNAQMTAECLGNLGDMVKQVILISHKPLENVDHHIELT